MRRRRRFLPLFERKQRVRQQFLCHLLRVVILGSRSRMIILGLRTPRTALPVEVPGCPLRILAHVPVVTDARGLKLDQTHRPSPRQSLRLFGMPRLFYRHVNAGVVTHLMLIVTIPILWNNHTRRPRLSPLRYPPGSQNSFFPLKTLAPHAVPRLR